MSTGRVDQIRAIMDRALHNAFKDRTGTITKKYVEDTFIAVPKRWKNVFKSLIFNSVITKIIIAAVLFGLIAQPWSFGAAKERKRQFLSRSQYHPSPRKKTYRPRSPLLPLCRNRSPPCIIQTKNRFNRQMIS